MVVDARSMRARTGCQACRERHIKCVRENASDKCQKCIENDRDCYQTSTHRFRPVTSVNLKTDDDRTVRQSLIYDNAQKWVEIPPQVEFVGQGHDRTPANQMSQLENKQSHRQSEPWQGSTDLIPEKSAGLTDQNDQLLDFAEQVEANLGLGPNDSAHDTLNFSPLHNAAVPFVRGTPSHASKRSRENALGASEIIHLQSPTLSGRPSWPFENKHQAKLFHYYIKEVAPWIDVCDPLCHFGKEVPRRAPYYPIISNAIYAMSARHMSMINNTPDNESPEYADKCLKILIESMNDPYAHWDENLLAAVVIMRLHEELSQDDDIRCHLFGTRRILDSISAFAADGGLRESASWVSLRQHIYVSLTEQSPLDINLQNFRHSAIFLETSTRNEDWANRMVFLFGTILDYAFTPRHIPAPERWHELRAEVDSWFNTKPWDFTPLHQNMNPEPKIVVSTPASVPGTATTPKGPPPFHLTRSSSYSSYSIKPWPEILMAHRSQVTALQYYHLARVVLAIYDPELTRLGFGSLRARKASEKIVLDGMRNIVGLAATNEDVTNAIFESCHILKTCGGYLKDEAEQNAAVEFLQRAQQRMGWTTGKTITELRSQWAGH